MVKAGSAHRLIDLSQEDKDNSRTTPFGLFNYADSFWRAAWPLQRASKNLATTHRDAPVSFLYYHAIELYLKSFLRHHGISVAELRGKKFGHDVSRLSKCAEILGLFLMDEDKEVFALMDPWTVLRARFIRTGPFTVASPQALDRTCKSLRDSIAKVLKTGGLTVRSVRRLSRPSKKRAPLEMVKSTVL